MNFEKPNSTRPDDSMEVGTAILLEAIRNEPAEILYLEIDEEDSGLVRLPLDCRPCDLRVIWAEARRAVGL